MQPLRVPASAGQQALCLLQEVDPDTPGLVLELVFRLGPATDVARLTAALDRLAARHPALRSRFSVHNGQWMVLTGPDTGPAGPIDLVAGPVFQARVEQDTLCVQVHHAVADLWSVGILVTELAALYSGADLGPVTPAAIAERSAERGWQFWRELLAEECAFALPAAPTGPATQRAAVHEPLDLGQERTDAIAATAKRLGITRYGVILAAQALTLGCVAGTERVPVGVSMHGRTRETRFDVGYHVSTVALPIDLGSGTTTDLLTRTAANLRSAQACQHLGYPELVELGNAEGINVPTPHTAVLLQQDTPGAPRGLGAALLGFGTVQIGELELTAISAPPSIGPFGLTTLLSDQDGTLRGRVELDPARHPSWLAESVATILPRAIDVLTGPEIPLHEASLVDKRHAHDLDVWGTSPMATVHAGTLPHLVLGSARQHPTRVAVQADDGFLTYAELDVRSASVANGLAARGVGRGDTVGVLMSRRYDLISVLLGILRSGAAYVPLDPGSPPGRLAEIAADARCALVVANRECARKVRGHMSTVDAAELVAAPPTGNGNAVSPDDMAYVLFTSGSTGKPKGVAISHANAVNLVRWAGIEFGPAELAETLAVTPITFDLSVFEMFVPLARGHRVRLVDSVLDLLGSGKGEPTLLNTVPSAVSALVERDALPRSLRALNMAGEPIPAELVAQIAQQRPGVRILNLYGPSETTTYSTYAELTDSVTDPVPIGGPVGGTVLRVVDGNLNPVPVGAVGELLIGGGGVAMGYLGRSALTARRFLPAEHGKRWYRTGDLVRWRPGGTLDFLGRVDHQVKVRGFRIELGEVEAGLRRVADLRDVAVCALRSGADRRLAGYLVPNTPVDDAFSWLRDVRQRLLADLPPHLVPAEFAILDELPRTPHGKVDRIKLSGMPTTALENREVVSPRTREEHQITEVWARLLDRPAVGVTDDFFALGGHSLVLTKLAAELATLFGVRVPVAELWNARTVAAQAALLKTLDRQDTAIPRLDRTRFITTPSGTTPSGTTPSGSTS